MTQRKLMTILSLESVDTFYKPVNQTEPTLDESAMKVVTDFNVTRPLMLEKDVTVDDAILLMKKAHVHMKLVVDKDERFLGVVSLMKLLGRKVLATANETGLSRAELTVADLMVPREELHALSFEDLQHSTIGDVLNTLKELGEIHILVLDDAKNSIRGVVSANDVAKYLHAPVEIQTSSASFVDVVKALT